MVMKKMLVPLCMGALLCAGSADAAGPGRWVAGDFHQHTYYTDGSTSFDFVMQKSNEFGLDWWANSEHGGERNRDGKGRYWDEFPTNPIKGAYELSDGHQEMWRWQSLRRNVLRDIRKNRLLYPDKRIFTGLEWNVPGHEHCSTGIVAEHADALSAFEYQFDSSDDDFSREGERSRYGILAKRNGKTNFEQGIFSVTSENKSPQEMHADAVAACEWMQKQYDTKHIDNGWIIFAHIERNGPWETGGYNIEHFRDFNNAAPDMCFGFEGAPGHQVNSDRGFGNTVTCDESGKCTSEDFGGTYGGVGYYSAQVGGLWDALLGEGRRWFNYANSDYHRHYTVDGDDFYPGEYQKTWVYALDKDGDGDYSLDEIADGLRSGNVYFVHGDLIDHLEFQAGSAGVYATMGSELAAEGTISDLELKIRFKSPQTNNCKADGVFITSCADPTVDHIDLIAGEIMGKVEPSDPNYTHASNPTAKVIATFTAKDFQEDKDGYMTVVTHIKNVDKSMYFRLRGTNLPPNTPFETDEDGNPLPDALVTKNLGIDGAQEAWQDLWFYSNPIFVTVK